jgi:hypothetical protein
MNAQERAMAEGSCSGEWATVRQRGAAFVGRCPVRSHRRDQCNHINAAHGTSDNHFPRRFPRPFLTCILTLGLMHLVSHSPAMSARWRFLMHPFQMLVFASASHTVWALLWVHGAATA